MKLAERVVKEAVYSRLSGDATLLTLVTGVYGDVPEGTAFPYVQIAASTNNPEDVFAREGADVTVTVHVWSQYHGEREMLLIAERVHTLLHRYALSVSGFTTITCHCEFAEPIRGGDGRTYQHASRYRVRLRSTS